MILLNPYFRVFSGFVSLSISVFGFMTVLPNVMISDNGNKDAIAGAHRGLIASKMFITTGLYGTGSSIFFPKHIKYVPLGFALSTAMQISAFIPIYEILNMNIDRFKK